MAVSCVELLSGAKNIVFLGEAGSGKTETAINLALRLAREGVAVVVLSSEAQEIIRVCDRALVLYHGALQGEVSGADMNEQTIMHLATGGAAPSAQAIHTEE